MVMNKVLEIPSKQATVLDEQSRQVVSHFRAGLPGQEKMTDEEVLALAEDFKMGKYRR